MKKLLLLFLLIIGNNIYAQVEHPEGPVHFKFGEGLGIVIPDSSLAINFRFRMQNSLAIYSKDAEDLSIEKIEPRVRRVRLRVDGFAYNTKLTYLLQLSFTRFDQDWDNTKTPNIVRDAVVFYRVMPHLTLGMGQTKLPGNRQNMTSSGSQQFVDRSIVNSTLFISRDYGIFAYYSNHLGNFYYNVKTAISSGEGRVNTTTDDGLAYTGRLELLPLGKFSQSGDFLEGDLQREKKPKISISAGYSYNVKAKKTGGQFGDEMITPLDLKYTFADFIVKYNGFSLSSELISKETNKKQIIDSASIIAFSGIGVCSQFSYLFKNNFEIAARYAYTEPENYLKENINKQEYFTLGVTKYFKGHSVKMQSNISYVKKHPLQNETKFNNSWLGQFLIELGI